MRLKRRIYYDANFSINTYRGMGKYINNFISVLNRKLDIQGIGLLTGGKEPLSDDYRSFGFKNYILWEQFSLPKLISTSSDIFIFPYNTAPLYRKKGAKSILFLHDLIFLKSSSSKSLVQKVGRIYRSIVVPRIVDSFKYIITVSEYSKKEIIEAFRVPREKVIVIPNAIKFDEAQIDNNISYTSRENFFFHVGGEPAYKNSKSILHAFSCLPEIVKNTYSLKVVGIRDTATLAHYTNTARGLGILEKVHFLPYQSDSEIDSLYSKAKLFIFPSLEEGFGIPIIEAFKFGCPVICSNQSCLPEIAGEAAHYYNPFVTTDLVNKIVEVLSDDELVHTKIKEGYNRAATFSLINFEKKVIEWFHEFCRKENVDLSNN